MDQTVINIILAVFLFLGGVAMTAIGWFANTIWTKLQEVERRQTAHEVRVAGDYVSNSELVSVIADIKSTMLHLVAPIQSDLGYIRTRVDGIPQRRESDHR